MNETVTVLLRDVGIPVAVLLFILWSGARGLWVYGRAYEREQKRADKFEDMAFRAIGAAEGGTEVAQKLAEDRKVRTAEIAAAVAEALAKRDP